MKFLCTFSVFCFLLGSSSALADEESLARALESLRVSAHKARGIRIVFKDSSCEEMESWLEDSRAKREEVKKQKKAILKKYEDRCKK